jgi:hypothetical protein
VVGRGTRLDVYLPLHRGPASDCSPAAAPTPTEQGTATILFVDDQAGIRRLASAVLSNRGYRVLLAEDGVAALDIFEREHESVDLVILDDDQRVVESEPIAGCLRKPWSLDELTSAIASALARRQPSSGT